MQNEVFLLYCDKILEIKAVMLYNGTRQYKGVLFSFVLSFLRAGRENGPCPIYKILRRMELLDNRALRCGQKEGEFRLWDTLMK
ncbi:MAG: hypothetical protein K2N94_03750 [Lachnospiraceae bacterium]|nr:hypothetical protein [Lachnospiraceae bacterium]